jgi:hypothetical protein
MNSLLQFVESLPYAKITLPYIDAIAAWGVALALLCAVAMVITKRRSAIYLFVLALLLTVVRVVSLRSDEYDDSMFVYNTTECTAVHMIVSCDTSYIVSFDERDEVDIDYVLKPALRSMVMEEPQWVSGDYNDENVVSRGGLVEFRGCRMKMLRDVSWQQDSVCVPVDVLLLCKGFKGAMDAVLEKYPAKRVVMDAGLHAMSRRRVMKECSSLGVDCVDVSSNGAVSLWPTTNR